jgi:phage portal protein BeeE
VAEASRLTGVPEHLLGSHDKQSSWGTGIAEQNRGLLTYTIDPDLVIVEQTISDELLRPMKRYMKFDRAALLRGSNLERAQYLEILRRNEIINADEWRMEEDMPPRLDGGGGEYKNPNTSASNASPKGV